MATGGIKTQCCHHTAGGSDGWPCVRSPRSLDVWQRRGQPAQDWPGCVSTTTRSAGDLREADAGLCRLDRGAAPNQLQAATVQTQSSVHPRAPEAPAPPSGPAGCCLGWGHCRGPPGCPAGPARPDLLGVLGFCQQPPLPHRSAARLGIWLDSWARAPLSHQDPQPPAPTSPRTQASTAASRPGTCHLASWPICPQPLPAPRSRPRSRPPGPRAPGRETSPVAGSDSHMERGRPSPQGVAQQGSKLCSWRAAWGANLA